MRWAPLLVALAIGLGATTAAVAAGVDGKILWSAGSNADLYVSNPDGSAFTRLTCFATPPTFSAFAQLGTWSSDGSKIAFQKYDFVGSGIYVMNGDGTGQQFVANGIEPAFSPDATKLAFTGSDVNNLYVVNTNGTGLQQLVVGTVSDPSWSPDGTQLAFSDVNNLKVLNADGSGLHVVASAPILLRSKWSPDGTRIAYAAGNDGSGEGREIYVVDAAGGIPTQITSNSLYDDYPGWTPSGRLTWTQNGQPIVADPDGTNQELLPWPSATLGGLGSFEWGTRALDAPEVDCLTAPNGSIDPTPVDTSSGPLTLSTDIGGTGATSDVPVQTALTIPSGLSGTVSVAQRPVVTVTPLTSYNFLGRELTIEAPPASAEDPLVITFTVDSTLLAQQGADYTTVQIVRTGLDGTSVILPACDGATAASPDPCVAARSQSGDDAQVIVRTSHASIWNLAIHQPYAFGGFFQPVDNLDAQGAFVLNAVKAGSAIPVRFTLNGDQGTAITAAGYPASVGIPCDPTLSTDAIEQTVSASKSAMTFDGATGRYVYTWKTSSTWTGCRQLVLKLADGSVHRADFKFSK